MSPKPKQPRQDDPPSQLPGGHESHRATPRGPLRIVNRETTACMLATTSMQHTHTQHHPQPHHTSRTLQ
eukprot:scaffold30340_cov31-Tisochrysis_lutea.AAC.1